MKKSILLIALGGLLAATQAWAINTLQVGAPGGAGEGTYANYQGSTSNPTETHTAITSGGTLYVAGVFGPNTSALGGQFGTGLDWGGFVTNGGSPTQIFPNIFNTHGAILVVSVPDTTLAAALATLKVGGNFAFHSDEALDYFPNSHDPVKDVISDFLFFDIGDFTKFQNVVPNFADETGAADGEIKTLTLSGFGSLAWAHFDVMAIETSTAGGGRVVTTYDNNPGSHDVTWKSSSSNGTSGQTSSGNTIPEPGMLALLSAGLLGQALLIRQRRRRQK